MVCNGRIKRWKTKWVWRPNMKTAKPWQKRNEHYNSITKRLLHELCAHIFSLSRCFEAHACKCAYVVCNVYICFPYVDFSPSYTVMRTWTTTGAHTWIRVCSEKVIIGSDSFFMNEKSNVITCSSNFVTWNRIFYVVESTNQGPYHSTMRTNEPQSKNARETLAHQLSEWQKERDWGKERWNEREQRQCAI